MTYQTPTQLSVATNEFSTESPVFALGTLNAERIVLRASQTSRNIDTRNVEAVTCTGCAADAVLFVWMPVAVTSSVTAKAFSNTLFRYSTLTSNKAACTVSVGSAVFDEFDCEESIQGRQAWVDFGRMALHVDGKSAVNVTKSELSKQVFGSVTVSTSVTSLSVTVPLSVKTFTIGENKQPLTSEQLTVGRLNITAAVTKQADVPFTTIKTFTPATPFANNVGRDINYLFTSASAVTAGGLVSHLVKAGVYRIGNTNTLNHCTVSDGCGFEEADCNEYITELDRMVGKFKNSQHTLKCASSLAFDTITYDTLAITQNHPVKVKTLTVDKKLSWTFDVSSQLVVVQKSANLGHRLTITAASGATVAVKKEYGGVVTASSKAVYLFTGAVTGAVANLKSMTCPSGTTYWAYTSAEGVSCTCWAGGAKLSDRYEENWCDAEFALGVPQASLDINDESPYFKNGIIFAQSAVTLTTSATEAIVTVPKLDVPSSLAVRGNVVIVTPTINAQASQSMDVLLSRVESRGKTMVVQMGASLDMTVGSLDGELVLKGSAVTASIASSTESSRVVVEGSATLRLGKATRVAASVDSTVTLVNSVAVVDQGDAFVVSGTNASVRTTRARLVLRDFQGMAVGTVGSTFSYALDGNVNLFVVGLWCGVALSRAKTQTQQQPVHFVAGGWYSGPSP